MPMIREGTRDDIPFCAAIIADSFLWRSFDRTVEHAVDVLTSSFAPGQRLFVHEDGGRPDGFVIVYERGMMGEFGYIRLIGVSSSKRGQGIGTRLLEAAETHLFTLSPFVFLTVTDFNTNARKLYEHLGYERIGDIPDYRRQGTSEFLYLKRRV